MCAPQKGMIADPVYEGKSMQGMIDLVQKGFFQRGRGSSTRISAGAGDQVMATPFAMADARQIEIAPSCRAGDAIKVRLIVDSAN
ncbi:hypothetical protein X733_32735 [Mesorhizobium sp. L2C067A000]|nr:hypothetical protein X733_32735 [Mesorhizobium sp. L2C067A000]